MSQPLFPSSPTILPVMARRSLGVVLIVALLGWAASVNQPLVACTGMNSRAAVGVPAGASPAHKPEPSPSRHSCCPPEGLSATEAQPSVSPICPFHKSRNRDCCSISGTSREPAVMPVAVKPQLVKFVLSTAANVLPDAMPFTRPVLVASFASPLPDFVSSAVLRL